MPENDRKDVSQDAVSREVEAAMNEQLAGLPPGQAEEMREKIRRRAQEGRERELEARLREKHHEEGELFQRFNRNFRFQHMVMFTSVILLIITGMPLKFPGFVLSRWVITFWGGIKNSTVVHRIGAGMLIYDTATTQIYTV